ncbi:hypothetical protein QFZ62_002620 [Clavibacter sp. B3I6]|jgi:hypothetical protein|nr:hypothetical protein [Clavibacter sp. B3I6]
MQGTGVETPCTGPGTSVVVGRACSRVRDGLRFVILRDHISNESITTDVILAMYAGQNPR